MEHYCPFVWSAIHGQPIGTVFVILGVLLNVEAVADASGRLIVWKEAPNLLFSRVALHKINVTFLIKIFLGKLKLGKEHLFLYCSSLEMFFPRFRHRIHSIRHTFPVVESDVDTSSDDLLNDDIVGTGIVFHSHVLSKVYCETFQFAAVLGDRIKAVFFVIFIEISAFDPTFSKLGSEVPHRKLGSHGLFLAVADHNLGRGGQCSTKH